MAQILWLSSNLSRNNLQLNSAGSDQIVVCAPIIYLDANVAGDLSGHTTEWVQLDGTPSVTIENVNQTQSFYLAGVNPGSNKTFRFYIDRYSQIEQYMDVIIRTTPTSFLQLIESGNVVNEINNFTLLQNEQFTYADFSFDKLPFNSEGRYITDEVILGWTLPLIYMEPTSSERVAYTTGYLGSVLEEWNGVDWVLLDTYGPADTREYPTTSTKRLRIGNVYFTPNRGVFKVYGNWFNADNTAEPIIKGKEVLAVLEPGILNNAISLNRIVFIIDNQTYIEPVYVMESGVYNDVTTERFVYILYELNPQSDLNKLESGVIFNKIDIIRSSGSVIGG